MERKKHSENWGGKREGAGRKFGTVKRKNYTRRLSEAEKEYLDLCLAQYRMLHPDPMPEGK